MIETEIKVRIDDPAKIKSKIKELNGNYKLSLEHEDIYLNMPKGLRDFQKTDEALRLRNSTQFDKNNKEETMSFQYFFTYKSKKLDKLTKTRKESEVSINDIITMKNILSELGFREVLTVMKKRELYEIPFEGFIIEALIDYIPVLKCYFMELELIIEAIEEVESARNILFKLLKMFGLDEVDSIRKSYLELIIEQ